VVRRFYHPRQRACERPDDANDVKGMNGAARIARNRDAAGSDAKFARTAQPAVHSKPCKNPGAAGFTMTARQAYFVALHLQAKQFCLKCRHDA
jgi:hypothetical protein